MCDIEALVKRDECNSDVLYQTRGQKSMKGVSNFVGVGSDELVYSSLGLFYFLAPLPFLFVTREYQLSRQLQSIVVKS